MEKLEPLVHAVQSIASYGWDALRTAARAVRHAVPHEEKPPVCPAEPALTRVVHRPADPEVETPCTPNTRAPLRVELVDRI